MDPVPLTPPEFILDYEDPVQTGSGSLPFCDFPPPCHQSIPAELKTSSCEPRMDGSALQKLPTVAEMLRNTAGSTPQTQTASNQTPVGPVQHQRSPSILHFLPGLSPSPLSCQDFPPDPPPMGLSPLFQELLFAPCPPQDPVWLNMSPLSVSPDSRFGGVSPCVLFPISSPTETWFNSDSPAHFRLPQPHFCPSWCLCPESIPVHQSFSPNLLSSRVESAVSGLEQSGEPCKSGCHRSKICKDEEKKHKEETPALQKLPAGDGVNEVTKPEASLPVLDPLSEESLANFAFEDYMTIMDALSPENQEDANTEAGKTDGEIGSEEEKLDVDSSSFLEYLDELCEDEEFVKKVWLMLDGEYLDSLLSSGLDPIDLLALEEQEKVTSTLNTEEQTDSFLSTDPDPAINFIPLKEQEPETLCLSPLLPSHLLDQTPGCQTENDGFPLPGEPLPYNGSLFMNCPIASSPPSPAETSPDSGPASGLAAGDGDLLALALLAADVGPDESEDALVSLENLLDDRSAPWSPELQDGSLFSDHRASESPSSYRLSGSPDDPRWDLAPSFGAVWLTDSPPRSTGPPALRVLALKTLDLLPPPLDQIGEAEEPNPLKGSDDTNDASPATAGLSFVEESCDPQTDDTDTSGSVPENQTVEPPEGPRVPQETETLGDVSDVGTRERQETETNCERDLEKGVGTLLLRKPNEEKGTIEKKQEENKETKPIRRSRRRSDQRVFGERKTEPEEERMKKTAELTPETDGGEIHGNQRPNSGEKQLCKTKESRGTNVINPERSGETADEKQDQKLAGNRHETGPRGDLSIETRQAKTSKEETVRTPGTARRRTRSRTAEGTMVPLSPVKSPSTRTRQKLKLSETLRSERKSSPERERGVQRSPEKRSRRREEEEKRKTVIETPSSGGKDVEEVLSSLPSPRAQTGIEPAQGDHGRLEESALTERGELLPAKTCNQRDERGDFYSLRTTTRNTRRDRKSEKRDATDRRGTGDNEATRRDASPDEINEEERRGVASSPVKRHRRRGGEKAEVESETHKSSPTKRTRRRKTSGTCNDEVDVSAGDGIQEVIGKKDGHSQSQTRRKGSFCKRGKRIPAKLPTKYEDFILCKRQTEKKGGKRKKRR